MAKFPNVKPIIVKLTMVKLFIMVKLNMAKLTMVETYATKQIMVN
jgi:hypothetical protein